MMTDKLYYKDAYIKEFSAVVISSLPCDVGFDTVLDRTAFFPEEGGQYSDRGYINGVRIFNVEEKDGVIHHYSKEQVKKTDNAVCSVDFDERFEKMQCHTAEHILSGIIHKLYGFDNVGFHLGRDDVTMDISAPLTRSELDRVETLANEAVYENIPVTTSFPTAEELSSLEYRSKLDITKNVRIVTVEGYDSCACCAPHVAFTGEIGMIKILDFSKLRGGIRIHIVAGRRAAAVFKKLYTNALHISAALCVPKEEISLGVDKMMAENVSLRTEITAFRMKEISRRAEEMPKTDGNSLIIFEGVQIPEMIEFSNKALSKVSGILVLLSGVEGDYKYVISSNTENLKERISDINKSLLGRGGGKANMVQGSFSSSLEDIKRYFSL